MALLGFPNLIRPNGSNLDSETDHFMGVLMLKNDPLIYRRAFLWSFLVRRASHDRPWKLQRHRLAATKVGFEAR